MGVILFLIVGVPVLVGVVVYFAARRSEHIEGWSCPHGYDNFGCQPECPLHSHCWGERES